MILNPLIVAMFALALAYFIYGMVEFLANAEEEGKRTTGKNHMLWGVVGMAIMFAVWGLLSLLVTTIGVDDDIDPETGSVNLDDYTPSKDFIPGGN